jgi:hypothetical protein
MKNLYDASEYTKAELIDILDLFNPSDRELEAKIVSNINKYAMSGEDHATTMVHFYEDIYDVFFDADITDNYDDVGEMDDVVEGFESSPATNQNIRDVSANIIPESKTPNTGSTTDNSFVSTRAFDFVKGTVNPVLKETIKRTISVDSQFRDIKVFPNSTEFTFNLDDVLHDVVSVKLYSIQIPYTWYNINNNYGSNFFYISGNSPGIDTENYITKIQIKSGNYESSDIVVAINASMQKVFTNEFPDVNFGTTALILNTIDTKCTFDIDIQNIYTENAFYLNFPVTSDPNKTLERFLTIPAFLGFNYADYFPSRIYSKSLSFINMDCQNSPRYTLTPENRVFYIYSFIGPSLFNPALISSPGYIINSIPITIDLNSVGTNAFNLCNIVKNISYQLSNNVHIIRSSFGVEDRSKINPLLPAGFMMDVTLNRKNTKILKDLKTVIYFPDISDSLWVGNQSIFAFQHNVNELNNVISETKNFSENYVISSNPFIYLKCIAPFYGGESTRVNDISFGLANSPVGGYDIKTLYTAFLKSVNDNSTAQQRINPNFKCICSINDFTIATAIGTGIPQITVDIQRKFNTSEFFMDISNSCLGLAVVTPQGTTPVGICNLDLSGWNSITNGVYVFSSSFSTNDVFIIDDLNNHIVIKSTGTYNKLVPDVSVRFDNGSYNVAGLESAINRAFTSQENNPTANGLYMMNTKITLTPRNGFNDCTLNVEIMSELTENNFTLNFLDPSSNDVYNLSNPDTPIPWTPDTQILNSESNAWFNVFHFPTNIYNLSQDTQTVLGSLDGSTSMTIKANSEVLTTGLFLTSLNNYFYIRAVYDASGGVFTLTRNALYPEIGFNDIRVSVADNALNKFYTSSALNALIQTAFDSIPILSGSTIDVVDSNVTTIRLHINKIFTGNDYKLVFYDENTFTRCNFGARSSVQNVTSDSTLGWIIGFRNIEIYIIQPDYLKTDTFGNTYYFTFINTTYVNNPAVSNVIKLTADTCITASIYNYFTLCLDDYTQNHINDGLVTITQRDTSIPLPSYANRTLFRCNRNTTGRFIGTSTEGDAANLGNNLTANQLYSANQILNLKDLTAKKKNMGIKTNDLFGVIPINVSKVLPGQTYVEYGGSLQIQERVYFGPVNINRMTVKLMNDKGGTVDLNNANWSFTLIAEMLYSANK